MVEFSKLKKKWRKLKVDLRKVHYLWRGKWRDGARKLRFRYGIGEVVDHKPDDEECDEADTEQHFEIGIVVYRNGASVSASLSLSIERRPLLSSRIGVGVGVGIGSRSAPNGTSSTSSHFWRIRDSRHRMHRDLEFDWRECLRSRGFGVNWGFRSVT